LNDVCKIFKHNIMILSLSLISLLQYITEVEINVLKNSLLIQLLYNASDIPRNRLYYGLKTFKIKCFQIYLNSYNYQFHFQ